MDDNISRRAVIDVIEDFPHGDVWNVESMEEMIDRIKLLPSAQPYTINPDGRLWITVDDIDKVTAVVVDEHKSKFCKQFYEDAQPKRGKWILDRSGAYCCSECMEPCATYVMMKPRDKYCKMCGSRNEVTGGRD